MFSVGRRCILFLVYTIIVYIIIRRASITPIPSKLVKRSMTDGWRFACRNHNISSQSVYYIIVSQEINKPSVDRFRACGAVASWRCWKYFDRYGSDISGGGEPSDCGQTGKVYRGIVEERQQNCELPSIIITGPSYNYFL